MADRKIKFLQDYEVKDEHAGTEKATKFKAGQQKTMNEASAAHFVRRGIAEYK